MPSSEWPLIQPTTVQRGLLPGTLIILASIGLGLSAGKGSINSLFIGLLIGGFVLFAVASRNYLELTDDALIVHSQFGKGTIPWEAIDDLRIEEVLGGSGLTVEAYGKINRLRVPKAGKALWADKDFDEKASSVIAAWETGKRAAKKGSSGKADGSPRHSGRVTSKAEPKDKPKGR